MKNLIRSKGFLLSLLAAACIGILTICFVVNRDTDNDFQPEEIASNTETYVLISSTPPTSIVQEDAEDLMAKHIAKSYEYGYPFVLDEVNLDVNADGKSDCIRLLENWYPIFNESDEPSYNPGGLHYPSIEFDVNGKKHTFVWDEPSYKSCLSAINNAESSNIVVVTRDIGGTGMGTIGINAFTFSDNIYELSLPSFETAYGCAQGFLATAPYSDNYCLTVLVEDTGFSGRLSLPENDFSDYSMYDDQGVCIDTERAATVGAICYARVTDYHGQDALELYQQISGTAPMEHFGYLVSVVTWEAEGYKVLEQRLESEICSKSAFTCTPASMTAAMTCDSVLGR